MSKTPNLGIDLRLSGHVQLQQTVKEGFEKIDAAIGPLGLNMNLSGHVPLQQTVEDGFNAVDALFGGSLPSNQAIVTDGDEITATGGQTISVAVSDNEAEFTVAGSTLVWNPFTVTAGEFDFGDDYLVTGFSLDPEYTIGSCDGNVYDDPVYTVHECIVASDGNLSIVFIGPRAISEKFNMGGTVDINGELYPVFNADASLSDDEQSWRTRIECADVPMMTLGGDYIVKLISAPGAL